MVIGAGSAAAGAHEHAVAQHDVAAEGQRPVVGDGDAERAVATGRACGRRGLHDGELRSAFGAGFAVPRCARAPRSCGSRDCRRASSGPVSTVTSMEWLAPGGSNSGASVQDRFAVGIGEQSQCGMSGATAVMMTAPPAPGPARIVAASQMVTGSSGGVLPLLVTVMTQWMGPPNGAGVHTLSIHTPGPWGGVGTGIGLRGGDGCGGGDRIARVVDRDIADAAVEVGVVELAVVVDEPRLIGRRVGRADVAFVGSLQAMHDARAALEVALLVLAFAQVLAAWSTGSRGTCRSRCCRRRRSRSSAPCRRASSDAAA